MKKFVLILLLLIPFVALADRASDFINQAIEYADGPTEPNHAHINSYGVNQEKLDIYNVAHPRFNFPKHIKDLNMAQAEQILKYFYDNYRFDDYKYDEIQEKVWDMMIHMPMSELENKINDSIRKYYEFDDDFYTPFGSVAGVDLLNGMKPENIPEFLLILNQIKY